MKKIKAKFLILLISVWVFGLNISFAFDQGERERFVYDSALKRDPFIPLVDKDSPSGLRTTFTPPETRVKLPMDIMVKGILRKDNEFFAIINDKVMRKGQSLGEVKIKEIKQDKVILEYSGREFILSLRKEKEK